MHGQVAERWTTAAMSELHEAKAFGQVAEEVNCRLPDGRESPLDWAVDWRKRQTDRQTDRQTKNKKLL